MTVATFTQPNYLTQSASAYKAALDAAIAVLQSIGGDFAPHAQSSPNMQIVIDAGRIFKPGGTMVSIAQQITGALIAPVSNPRIDRVVVDSESGVYSILTGTEAVTPVAPTIPNGKLPVCQISMTVGMTTIANSIITDERTTYGPLAKLMRMPVEQVQSATTGFTREILLADRGTLFDCDCSNGPIDIILPDSAQAGNGFMIGVMKSDAVINSITLVPSTTGEVFSDGSATKQVSVQNGVVIITTDGLGQWYLAFDSSRTYDNVTLTGTTTADVINAGAISGTTVAFSGLISANGGQIQFPATQNASADANTLDDYEEGTFTPGLQFGGAAVGMTFTTQAGAYTKIGRKVDFSLELSVNAKGSSVGQARITGLPFTSNAQKTSCTIGNLNAVTFANQIISSLPDASTSPLLQEVTEAGVRSNLDDTNFSNGSYIILSGTYFV